MLYLLTAIELSPGGSSTVHIYTQKIHRTIQNKQYIEQHKTIHRTTQQYIEQHKQYIEQHKQGKKEPRKKSQVTPPGIDPGTVRLVAHSLNHYATPGPFSSI